MLETSTLIKKELLKFKMIHFAIVMGNVIYGFVIYFIYTYTPITPSLNDNQMITNIEYGFVPLILGIIFVANKIRTTTLTSNSIFIQKREDKEDSNKPPFLVNYLSMLFIIWAVLEIISVGGVVFFLISGELMISLGLIALGVFFLMLNGPQLKELESLSEGDNNHSL
ncbi:MAG: hypothetical protein PHI02_03030 [Sulfurovaceae bacterium]|nr:hypothetical protein [Sulfurovaceae bacterium]